MKESKPAPDWPYPVTGLVETRLQGDRGATYLVNHDPGPSDDDGFEFFRVVGRRRKYRVLEGRLQEVRQPFYYAGLETRAETDVVLYSDTHSRTKVARIPKGGKLTVLLASTNRRYLAKTGTDLVGWFDSPEAVGIFPHGD